MSQNPTISSRKEDHILLCAEDEVEFRHKTTLLEDIELMHDALPELSMAQIDLSTQFMGKTLKMPLLITGMTGGAERAQKINRELAIVAQAQGLAMGVGSQRAILRHPALAATYQVRDVAPDIVLLGNIGGVQAAEMTSAELEDLAGTIGADAMCIHLNPGQELIQPEGDRDFRGVLDAITAHVEAASLPIIIKETGCGLGTTTLDRLRAANVQWVDTSGAGGTTWIGVETLRTPEEERDLGELLWEWGVPTAASVAYARRRQMNVIASGGIRSGADIIKALSMGAHMTGMALPWLKSIHEHGVDGAMAYGHRLERTLRAMMLLTGSKNADELRAKPKLIGARLQRWLDLDHHR